MKQNKEIDRSEQGANAIFDERTLAKDYRTLSTALKSGLSVLDVGCGTGAISKDIAAAVGPTGRVTGIDNTESFIVSGKKSFALAENLDLIYTDLFNYQSDRQFDLVISARTLQWLSNPQEALTRMKSFLKTGGVLSVLDYNHEAIEWDPAPPESMKRFYDTFLRWRADAGMNNKIAEDLPEMFRLAGMKSIEVYNADEHYHKAQPDFKSKAGVWIKVASSRQMVDEGYIHEVDRLEAIAHYSEWINKSGITMTMKLSEVRGVKG